MLAQFSHRLFFLLRNLICSTLITELTLSFTLIILMPNFSAFIQHFFYIRLSFIFYKNNMNIGKTYCGKTIRQSIMTIEENVLLTLSLDPNHIILNAAH